MYDGITTSVRTHGRTTKFSYKYKTAPRSNLSLYLFYLGLGCAIQELMSRYMFLVEVLVRESKEKINRELDL